MYNIKDCFGGKTIVYVYDSFLKTNSPQEYDKPNSAYMLMYEGARSEVHLDSPVPSTNSCIKILCSKSSLNMNMDRYRNNVLNRSHKGNDLR